MGNKLYVGNLSFDTIENDLQDLFAQAGSVTDCALMQDKMTGKSRGFAFVTMSSDDEAQKADQPLPWQRLPWPRPHRQRSPPARRSHRQAALAIRASAGAAHGASNPIVNSV